MYKAKKKYIYIYTHTHTHTHTWLQAYFLGDVRVIWCNSLSDSHFQIYVMNNVEILVDYYLHITLYVSHALTSYTHITSNSLLSFVHEIECKLMWPSKIIHFVMFDAKFFEGWFKLCVLKNFWNHLHAFHVMKNLLKNDSAKKILVFQKNSVFQSLDQSNVLLD